MVAKPKATAAVVEAALTFLVPGDDKARVVMPADDADRVERTGTYRDVPVTIRDARHLGVPPSLDREGFALVRAPTATTDFFDPARVARDYYPEVIELLKRCTGAGEVHVFDHTVRVEDATTGGRPGVRQPVACVHNDYTERSAQQRMSRFFPPQEAARLQAARVAFVNVWRSIGPSAERFPLAAADGRSVPQTDYVAVDMVYADRVGEVYHNTYSAGQRWFYFADMRPDEAMLLKCFDSATDGRTRHTAHTGFANPRAASDTPPRRSIEVRTILCFAG
ncbi:MAG TPA: CmcJ/NvfI family oxidoreductase [Burkholderiaceae bacterium]|nr:CmcJ/NvfI family oxidoreductase [Burkholderiaceae bacterium]